MAKQRFLPTTLEGQRAWLQNFAAKLPTYASKYGINSSEYGDITLSNTNLAYWMDFENLFTQFAKKVSAYRRELMNGVPDGEMASLAPVPPSPAASPSIVAVDIIGRATAIAMRIKAHKDYVESDGQDMGLEGAEIEAMPAETQADIKARIGDAGKVHIDWKKTGFDAIEIHKSLDGINWNFLAIDSVPNYIDNSNLPAVGQSAVWHYKAIYRKKDEQVGQWSNVTSIPVAGV